MKKPFDPFPHTALKTLLGREPPYSQEAEEYLLSCCLLDGAETVARCLNLRIPKQAFYFLANQVIYDKICVLYSENHTIAVETLVEEMRKDGTLETVGGIPYLMQISGRVPSTAEVSYFAERVRRLWQLRELAKLGVLLIEKVHTNTGELREMLEPFSKAITDIELGSDGQAEKSLTQAAAETIEKTEKIIRGETLHEPEISFGFPDMDRLFYPMMGGELVVLAARPSFGKTSLADQIALHTALREGKSVAYFTLEVTVEQKPHKFAQILSGHSWRRLRKLHPAEQQEFLEALRLVQKANNLHVFYREQSLEGICAKIRSLHRRGKLHFAIVDYLQLMDLPEDEEGNRNLALGAATRKFKLLAISLQIPILVLSQLNRLAAGTEPQMYHLRESGNIEADADRVILIHRPEKDAVTGLTQNLMDETTDNWYQEIIQAKGRDVGCFNVGTYFQRSATRFRMAAKPTQVQP